MDEARTADFCLWCHGPWTRIAALPDDLAELGPADICENPDCPAREDGLGVWQLAVVERAIGEKSGTGPGWEVKVSELVGAAPLQDLSDWM